MITAQQIGFLRRNPDITMSLRWHKGLDRLEVQLQKGGDTNHAYITTHELERSLWVADEVERLLRNLRIESSVARQRITD